MNHAEDHVTRRAEADMLRAEIHRFETHLATIAEDDDCAYGKARIRAFETLLQEHRHRLDRLTADAGR